MSSEVVPEVYGLLGTEGVIEVPPEMEILPPLSQHKEPLKCKFCEHLMNEHINETKNGVWTRIVCKFDDGCIQTIENLQIIDGVVQNTIE